MRFKMDDMPKSSSALVMFGVIAPGYDGWVVGNEPAVFIDITGMVAKQS